VFLLGQAALPTTTEGVTTGGSLQIELEHRVVYDALSWNIVVYDARHCSSSCSAPMAPKDKI
jgi:hypothetical protein